MRSYTLLRAISLYLADRGLPDTRAANGSDADMSSITTSNANGISGDPNTLNVASVAVASLNAGFINSSSVVASMSAYTTRALSTISPSAISTTAIMSATMLPQNNSSPVTAFAFKQPINTPAFILGSVCVILLLFIALLIWRNHRLTRPKPVPLCSTDPYTSNCVDAAFTDANGDPVLPIYSDSFGRVISLTPSQPDRP